MMQLAPRIAPAVLTATDGVIHFDYTAGGPSPVGGFQFSPFPGHTGKLTLAYDEANGLIWVGGGEGAGPRVGVFDLHATPLADFFAYEPTFLGGVNVGASRGLGYVTPNAPGGPVLSVFDQHGVEQSRAFVGPPDSRNGATVYAPNEYSLPIVPPDIAALGVTLRYGYVAPVASWEPLRALLLVPANLRGLVDKPLVATFGVGMDAIPEIAAADPSPFRQTRYADYPTLVGNLALYYRLDRVTPDLVLHEYAHLVDVALGGNSNTDAWLAVHNATSRSNPYFGIPTEDWAESFKDALLGNAQPGGRTAYMRGLIDEWRGS